MSRIVFVLAALIALSFVPAQADAQTCVNPRCAPGYHCIYVGTDDNPNNPTTCIPNEEGGTVDEIVVTGKASSGTSFAGVVDKLVAFADAYVIPLLYALAFIIFLIGVARYFFTGGEENRTKARPFVIWGLIGLVAIFSIWGIVNLLLTVLPGK